MLRSNLPIGLDAIGGDRKVSLLRRLPLVRPRLRWWQWALLAFVALVGWLALTAPLSKSLEPLAEPGVTLLAADGTPIARRGASIAAPTRVERLPDHVYQAFLAIEDNRFYDHNGISLRSMLRAAFANARAGEVRQGGSTITQQLAKLTFLESDRTVARKLREVLIALWMEAWLSKNDILSRYLSTIYFGDNVYGLRAAARHYFDTTPEALTVGEAAMLAGLVKAPSRLAPTRNPQGAQERMRLVLDAMEREGVLADADSVATPQIERNARERLPSGSWFADWAFERIEAEDEHGAARMERRIRTTLDPRLQRLAERVLSRADLGGAEAALVAMRPDGRVLAMAGGTDYTPGAFNRATDAKRQPGSTFKLFVYLAALEDGLRPDSPVLDVPVAVDGWTPANADGRYRGAISLRDAFAASSNVAAVRLSEQVGRRDVVAAARRLGVESPLEPNPSLPLGTSAMTLLELTSAYAAVAANRAPVRPRWTDGPGDEGPAGEEALEPALHPLLLDLLWQAANEGTGRAAALRVPTFGKTGTSQDNRDALFVGFVQGLVVGIWVGHDDNRPMDGISGSGLPAEIWRKFVGSALDRASTMSRTPLPSASVNRRPEAQIERPRASPRPQRSFFRDDDPRWGERGRGEDKRGDDDKKKEKKRKRGKEDKGKGKGED